MPTSLFCSWTVLQIILSFTDIFCFFPPDTLVFASCQSSTSFVLCTSFIPGSGCRWLIASGISLSMALQIKGMYNDFIFFIEAFKAYVIILSILSIFLSISWIQSPIREQWFLISKALSIQLSVLDLIIGALLLLWILFVANRWLFVLFPIHCHLCQ